MVRVGTPSAVARPDWYDRNPISKNDNYDILDITPHSTTTRLTYTVPAGKKAMLEILQATVRRRTAATTLGRAYALWQFTPSGDLTKILLFSRVEDNTVGAKDDHALGTTMAMYAGDRIDGNTYDGSTGGTCDYTLSYKITEFNA